MTWSLALRNGDLTLSSASYGTVTGEDKLVQDLRAFILERMGTDDMHPSYGSLLDGGRLPDGTEKSGPIGSSDIEFAQLEIETELRRIISIYQNRQLARAKDDRLTYGKTTLSKSEVLLAIQGINFRQVGDTLNVQLNLQTAANTTIPLTIDVG
jgi:hypothetical protein